MIDGVFICTCILSACVIEINKKMFAYLGGSATLLLRCPCVVLRNVARERLSRNGHTIAVLIQRCRLLLLLLLLLLLTTHRPAAGVSMQPVSGFCSLRERLVRKHAALSPSLRLHLLRFVAALLYNELYNESTAS